MERLKLTPPGEGRARGGRARLYLRWMPHIGAEAVALYELLRILPDVGNDDVEVEELADLLRSTPEGVEEAFGALVGAGFVVERDGWLEVAEQPPSGAAGQKTGRVEPPREVVHDGVRDSVREKAPVRDVQVIRAEPEGVSADDYFRFIGTLRSEERRVGKECRSRWSP